MPFTLTHVAAVVPIKKLSGQWLPFTALALGAMVPDIPMFLKMPVRYVQTHSFEGIFIFCLPMALLLYAVFQLLVRTPLLELMPNSISHRLGERRPHTPGYVLLVAVALTLGAGTHVLWDSFTHAYGLGVELFPALKQHFIMFNRSQGYYKLLQHGSSVVFLPLLAWWLHRWMQTPFISPARPYRSRLFLPSWARLAGCALIFLAPALYACIEAWVQTQSLYWGIGHAARAYGRYLIYTALAVSVALHVLIQLRQKNQMRGAT